MRKEYEAVSLQKDLIRQIDEIIQNKGFSSRAEFVRFCIFRELERRKYQEAKHGSQQIPTN